MQFVIYVGKDDKSLRLIFPFDEIMGRVDEVEMEVGVAGARS